MRALFKQLFFPFTPTGRMRPPTYAGIWPPGFSLDRDSLMREVEARASAAGRENLPAPDATGPDNNEKWIASSSRESLRFLSGWYQDQLSQEQLLRDQAAATCDAKSFEAHYQAALRELTSLDATYRELLMATRYEERQRWSELQAFRAQHRLTREADYPEGWQVSRVLPVAMVFAEALANCHFFAIGSYSGVYGGIQEALLVALPNVIISYHAGAALRGLHSAGTRRLAAGVLGGVYVVGLSFYHLAVGHYRMALALGNPESAALTAMTNFIHAPLALTDFHSWLLVLVGMVSGIGAALSGYKADDPLPGYGAVSRRYKTAATAYRHCKEQYLLGIQETIEAHLRAVEQHEEAARVALYTYSGSLSKTRRLVGDYQLTCETVSDICVDMLQEYRFINRRVRHLLPPAYFMEEMRSPLEDDLKALSVLEATELAHGALDCTQELQHLQDTVAEVRRQFQELHQESLKNVPRYFEAIEGSVDRPLAYHYDRTERPQEEPAEAQREERPW